jgi:hypothetical protein
MRIEPHRAVLRLSEEAVIPSVDIAGPIRPRGKCIPEWTEALAAVERDRLDALVFPQGLGGFALAILEGVEALAGACLQVECLQQILDRRIFGGVADKDDLEPG